VAKARVDLLQPVFHAHLNPQHDAGRRGCLLAGDLRAMLRKSAPRPAPQPRTTHSASHTLHTTHATRYMPHATRYTLHAARQILSPDPRPLTPDP
jgi:hypothetical protein